MKILVPVAFTFAFVLFVNTSSTEASDELAPDLSDYTDASTDTMDTGTKYASERAERPKRKKRPPGKGPRQRRPEAQQPEQAQPQYTRAYGMAGCGLGSMVIADDSIMQIFAATTNGTSGSQTFGISTGTSNCETSPAMVAMEQEVFLEANLASLAIESAQGGGHHMLAFAELLGCDQSQLIEVSLQHHAEIYSQNDPKSVLARYRELMQGSCKRVG